MAQDDLVDTFDKRIASVWLVIALGVSKAIEHSLRLLDAHFITVGVGGVDMTMLALYAILATAGTTALIFSKTL